MSHCLQILIAVCRKQTALICVQTNEKDANANKHLMHTVEVYESAACSPGMHEKQQKAKYIDSMQATLTCGPLLTLCE